MWSCRWAAFGKSVAIMDMTSRITLMDLMTQHCDPPYRAIGYSYAYRIYVFRYRRVSRYNPPPPRLGVSQVLRERGGVSQVNAALSARGRYRGVMPGILSQITVEWVTKLMEDSYTKE